MLTVHFSQSGPRDHGDCERLYHFAYRSVHERKPPYTVVNAGLEAAACEVSRDVQQSQDLQSLHS